MMIGDIKMIRKKNVIKKRKVVRKRKKRGYKSKGMFKDKTTAKGEHMFAGTFSFAQEMEGSTTDGIYSGPATFLFAAASATAGAGAGASTSDTNLEEEQVCEGYETDEMKSIHDKDSDDEGLDSALELVCHGATHRYCCRHIFANFIKKFSNTPKYERAFWACAKATTQRHFAEAMMVFDRLNKDAAKWLNDIPIDRWSRSAFDTVCKNQAVASNMCEQFNGAILKYRGKPIIAMLEGKAIYWTPHWSGDPNRAKFEETNDKIYSNYINLAAGEGFWETTGFDPIQPPIVKRKPGKPKTKRKKAPEKDSNPHKMKRKLGPPRCSRCKQVGHKKTSCKANLGDGDTIAATNETRPSDVPVDGANEETRASQGPWQHFPYADDLANMQVTPLDGIAFRPPPVRPSMMPHLIAPITKETIEGASAGTAQRFIAFMYTGAPRPPQ
ncbi:hypothetical protein CRG98_007764 [Punica granatum]|uniref:CCHC-type domain-containing protein n=1 Tax=Punica granatum TaxID=22663 RepID=A0A2I0KTL4_PUNGR|nr:hypothetical protein CRG98_007764 [Punica granatum]